MSSGGSMQLCEVGQRGKFQKTFRMEAKHVQRVADITKGLFDGLRDFWDIFQWCTFRFLRCNGSKNRKYSSNKIYITWTFPSWKTTSWIEMKIYSRVAAENYTPEAAFRDFSGKEKNKDGRWLYIVFWGLFSKIGQTRKENTSCFLLFAKKTFCKT